jgi:hypothetical protein
MICPIIIHLVDDSNIYKISKIIHLAFKASSFEQEFFYAYLCVAVERYDHLIEKEYGNELNMQEEKLGVLIEKIPVLTLMERCKNILMHAKNK